MKIGQRPRARLETFAALILMVVPVFTTGCLTHTHSVPKTRRADIILSATLDQLLKQVDDRYSMINSLTAKVEIVASTGGSLQGEVKDSIAFSGYIIIGKPENIRVLLTLPVVGTRAFDMVSDGNRFKVYIPPRNRAIIGSDQITTPSSNGLENLRPAVILDSMLVRGFGTDNLVSMTQDTRVIENPRKKNDLIEVPDYDLEFLSEPKGQIARTLRVIHISRADLLPYRQDIYDAEGKVVTQASYSDYKKLGDVTFPSQIIVKRPLDQYSLTITIIKVDFNKVLPGDQFTLEIPPEGVTVQDMDVPAPRAQSAPRAQQSPH